MIGIEGHGREVADAKLAVQCICKTPVLACHVDPCRRTSTERRSNLLRLEKFGIDTFSHKDIVGTFF